MRRALALAWILLALAAAGDAAAQDRPAVVVTPGSQKTFKAAIQRFADRRLAPDAKPLDELRGGIGRGLEFSALFSVIDPKAFLGPETTTALDAPAPPACPEWSQIGADAFLEGEMSAGTEGLVVEFRVWDVVRCRSLLRKRYFGTAQDLDTIARRIADDVVREFTGLAGVSATEVAFISDRSGRKEVYVMNADGGNVRAATRNRSINAFPAWSPGGEELVYTSYRMGGQPALFLLTRGRRQPGQLLARVQDGVPIYRGVFSPSGDRLAFVMSVDGAPEIFTARPDGRSMQRLTRHRSIDIGPSWSPDGKRIAFVSDRAGSPQVYVMDAGGDNLRRLTFQGAYNTGPAWSPDGNWIAYESRVGAQFDIWLIDPEGRESVPLISHPGSDEGASWAPDGRSIAFSSTRRGSADIYSIGIDGRNLRRLTQGSGNNTSPAWGPFAGKR